MSGPGLPFLKRKPAPAYMRKIPKVTNYANVKPLIPGAKTKSKKAVNSKLFHGGRSSDAPSEAKYPAPVEQAQPT